MELGRRATELGRRRERRRVLRTTALGTSVSIAVIGLVVVATPDDLDPAFVEPSSQSGAPAVGVAAITATSTHSPPHQSTSTMPPKPRTFTIAVTGDVLLHTPVSDRAAAYGRETGTGRDFRPMFDAVRTVLSGADLALCHLETPLSVDGSNLHGYPVFNSAPEIAPALADAGYDGCSTASNHSFDRGDAGVRATLDRLDAAGVGHAGTARSSAEDDAPRLYRVGDATVAHLSYTTFLNGAHPNESWVISMADPEHLDEVRLDTAAARAAGADFVIVSVHWGSEFVRAPTAGQRSLADALTAMRDIDVVVGHHSHVVQPVERINDKWVVFGLGNSLSNQQDGCCPVDSEDGVVVRITVEELGGRFVARRLDFTPTWVDRSTFRILPAATCAVDGALEVSIRLQCLRSRARTAEALQSGGNRIPETRGRDIVGPT